LKFHCMSEGARFSILRSAQNPIPISDNASPASRHPMASRRRCAHLSGVTARLILPATIFIAPGGSATRRFYLFDGGSLFNGRRLRKSHALSWSERPARIKSDRFEARAVSGKALNGRERNPRHAPPRSSALSRALISTCASVGSHALSRAVGGAAHSPAQRRSPQLLRQAGEEHGPDGFSNDKAQRLPPTRTVPSTWTRK
jgi:hypothetical protein